MLEVLYKLELYALLLGNSRAMNLCSKNHENHVSYSNTHVLWFPHNYCLNTKNPLHYHLTTMEHTSSKVQSDQWIFIFILKMHILDDFFYSTPPKQYFDWSSNPLLRQIKNIFCNFHTNMMHNKITKGMNPISQAKFHLLLFSYSAKYCWVEYVVNDHLWHACREYDFGDMISLAPATQYKSITYWDVNNMGSIKITKILAPGVRARSGTYFWFEGKVSSEVWRIALHLTILQ